MLPNQQQTDSENMPDAELWLREALDLHQRGELGNAKISYEKIIALAPDNFIAIHQLGVINNQWGNFKIATEYFETALKLQPRSSLAHFNMGIALGKLDRPEESLSHYQYSLFINPNNPGALLNSAVVLRELHRYQEALACLDRLLSIEKKSPDAILNYGIILQELRRYKDALANFEELVFVAPENIAGHLNLGKLLGILGRPHDALSCFDRALAIQPDNFELLLSRGNILLDLGRLEEASNNLERGELLKPNRPRVLNKQTPLYQSCSLLENGINFIAEGSRKWIQPCCINSATGLAPVLQDISIDDFDLKIIQEKRQEIIEAHKRGEICRECQQCPSLAMAAWNDQPRVFAICDVTLFHFNQCNIECNYCYTVNLLKNDVVSARNAQKLIPIFQQMIEGYQLDPHAIFRFGGGEPLLLPEFDELLSLLLPLGAHLVIHTNATILSTALLNWLPSGQITLICGVDAASSGVYQKIKKRDLFERVYSNVTEYAHAGGKKVHAKFILLNENIRETRLFVDCFAAAGVSSILFDLDSSLAIGSKVDPLPDAMIEAIAHMKHACNLRSLTFGFGGSGAGTWIPYEGEARLEIIYNQLYGNEVLNIPVSVKAFLPMDRPGISTNIDPGMNP